MATEIPKSFTLEQTVFGLNNCAAFTETALSIFRFQYYHNTIYRQFCNLIDKKPDAVKRLTDIPFLPVSFFKTHAVCTTEFSPQVIFQSSGTTGITASRHLVKDTSLYEQSFLQAFKAFYGAVDEYCILGLLPSYLERNNSSLVYMVDKLIKKSNHSQSNFYLHDYKQLATTIQSLETKGQKTIVIGVTYALIHFAEKHPMPLKYTTIMETGGMKGRKQELVRSEVHRLLKDAFSVNEIHSEYGMTELLSQAYAVEGRFKTPPWMKILIRHEDDPFAISDATDSTVTGGINIIDLANIYSCSFIAVDDIGKLYSNGSFEVLGRLDNSDIRGCSLLAL